LQPFEAILFCAFLATQNNMHMPPVSTEREDQLDIKTLQLKKAALVFRAVNHPLRMEMLRLLHKQQKMDVTSLYVKLRLEQSVASQHLAILRRVGFVSTQREGKKVFYSVNYTRLEDVTKRAKELIQSN
jgi:DNA-binding transcriptional ArsR family regulator